MRSTRATKRQSPTSASMSASASAQADPAATPRMSAASGPRGATKVAGGSTPSARAAGQEAVPPAGGVEATGPVGRHPVQQALPGPLGKDPQLVGRGERGVAEVHGVDVGPRAGQRLGDQAEVEVLDEDHRALGRDLGDRGGERLVDLDVGVPGRPPVAVDHRAAGLVVEAVMDEPQGGVGHDVVEGPVGVRRDGQGPEPEALDVDHPLTGRLTVGVRHGRRHPHGVGAGHERADARDQAAGAPPGHQPTLLVVAEGDRAPVGHHHQGSIDHGEAP